MLSPNESPILVLVGERDRVLPAPLGRTLAADLQAAGKQVRLIEAEAADHFTILDDEALMAELVNQWQTQGLFNLVGPYKFESSVDLTVVPRRFLPL
jgi:pimeloyl-ACP methyl ester carboxylesterase